MFLTLMMQVVFVFLVMLVDQIFTVLGTGVFAMYANPHPNNDDTEKGYWCFSEMVVKFTMLLITFKIFVFLNHL